MAKESEPVQDLVMGLSSALEEFNRLPDVKRQLTNPTYRQLLDRSEKLTDAFRAAAASKRNDCPAK
jgi:hypothetical protein